MESSIHSISLSLTNLNLIDLANVTWHKDEVVKLGSDIEKLKQIKEKTFSDLPGNLSQDIQRILDRNYSIFVMDNGNIRSFWVDQVDEKNQSIVEENQMINGEAFQFLEALTAIVDLFHKTIGKGQPYEKKQWFGENGPYHKNFKADQAIEPDSRLDKLLVDTRIMLILKKVKESYELTFENEVMNKKIDSEGQEKIEPIKTEVKIQFQNLTLS